MSVVELIDLLYTYPPEAEVWIDPGDEFYSVEITTINQYVGFSDRDGKVYLG